MKLPSDLLRPPPCGVGKQGVILMRVFRFAPGLAFARLGHGHHLWVEVKWCHATPVRQSWAVSYFGQSFSRCQKGGQQGQNSKKSISVSCLQKTTWMGGRVDEGGSLENCCDASKTAEKTMVSEIPCHRLDKNPELQRVIDAWPELSEGIRRAILTLADTPKDR